MFEKLKKLDRILSTSTEDRRREAREDLVDGVATISSQQYPLKNWSASGFCVGPCMIAQYADQIAILRGMSCEYGQGYHFSPPLNVADAHRLLASNDR